MLKDVTLYSSPTSPFARRVRIALRQMSLAYDEVTVENLFPPPPEFLKLNPLGLIPVLIAKGFEPIPDSNAILEFLDDHDAQLWPRAPEHRWAAKKLGLLATGILTDAVAWRLESIRPDSRGDILKFRENSIINTLQNLFLSKVNYSINGKKPHQGIIEVGIALQYLSFRLPHLDWETVLNGTDETLWDCLDGIPAFEITMPPGLAKQV